MDRGEGVYERVERPYVRFIDWQQQTRRTPLLLQIDETDKWTLNPWHSV